MSDNGDLIFVARTNASPWIFKLKRWNAGSGLTTMHNITVPSGSDSLYLIKSSIDGNRLFYSLTTTTPTTAYNYNVYDSTTNANSTLNLGADIDLARLNYYNGYFSDDGRYFVLGFPINYLYDLSNGNRVLLAPGLGFGGKASSDLKTSYTNDSLTGALIKIDGTNLFSTAFPTTVPEQPKTFTYSRPTLKSNSIALSWGHVKGTDGYKLKRNGSLIATWSGTSLPSGGASGQWNYAYTLADFKDQDTFEIIPFNKFGDGPGKQLTLVPPK
ncbi:hypothetical protein, partial [Paenibacillus periandrae]|uniref:hypothetical protein n=1 Tax=Paenibacillus periandrae TaxID=1761741 RepID=UPI001F08FB1F